MPVRWVCSWELTGPRHAAPGCGKMLEGARVSVSAINKFEKRHVCSKHAIRVNAGCCSAILSWSRHPSRAAGQAQERGRPFCDVQQLGSRVSQLAIYTHLPVYTYFRFVTHLIFSLLYVIFLAPLCFSFLGRRHGRKQRMSQSASSAWEREHLATFTARIALHSSPLKCTGRSTGKFWQG